MPHRITPYWQNLQKMATGSGLLITGRILHLQITLLTPLKVLLQTLKTGRISPEGLMTPKGILLLPTATKLQTEGIQTSISVYFLLREHASMDHTMAGKTRIMSPVCIWTVTTTST